MIHMFRVFALVTALVLGGMQDRLPDLIHKVHAPCSAYHWARVKYAPRMFITYYTATGNRTATGTWPVWGTVAVAPNYPVPQGSFLCIEGLPIMFHAEDTGGLVGGYHIDVFCPWTSSGRLIPQCPTTGYRRVYWFSKATGPGW